MRSVGNALRCRAGGRLAAAPSPPVNSTGLMALMVSDGPGSTTVMSGLSRSRGVTICRCGLLWTERRGDALDLILRASGSVAEVSRVAVVCAEPGGRAGALATDWTLIVALTGPFGRPGPRADTPSVGVLLNNRFDGKPVEDAGDEAGNTGTGEFDDRSAACTSGRPGDGGCVGDATGCRSPENSADAVFFGTRTLLWPCASTVTQPEGIIAAEAGAAAIALRFSGSRCLRSSSTASPLCATSNV